MSVKLEPLTMEAAAAFWKDKVILGPGEFNRLSDQAKIRAFAVAGIAKGDELTTVFNSIQRAIEKGISFSEFKKDCAKVFERRGWTGKRDFRVQNIFRTNIQTAYNSGRWQQQKKQAGTFPYLQYSAINDTRTRKTHLALDGLVFPIDHPFWDDWYPPNGFRCRCTTLSLTKRQIERRGLKVQTENPTGKPIALPNPLNKDKLHTQQLRPDPGSNHHPGKVVWGGMVDSAVDVYGRGFKPMPGLQKAADYRRPALTNVKAANIPDAIETMFLKKGLSDEEYKNEFIKRYGSELVVTDAAGEPVILSLRSFMINKTNTKKNNWKFSKDGHGEIIPMIREMVENPYEIWLTPQKNSKGKIRLSKRYIALWKTADKKRIGGLLAFEVVNGVFQGVTAFIPRKKSGTFNVDYMERMREGLLLYKRKGNKGDE